MSYKNKGKWVNGSHPESKWCSERYCLFKATFCFQNKYKSFGAKVMENSHPLASRTHIQKYTVHTKKNHTAKFYVHIYPIYLLNFLWDT